MVNKNYTTTLSCFTLFFCKLHSISTWFKDLRGLSVWMGMSLMIETSPSWNAWVFFLTLNVVHPWITMLRSPQCLFQLFFYLQPDKQITRTASLSLLPACSFLHLTCSPLQQAAQCAWCAGQYRFSGLRENSAALSFSISPSLASFQTSHISSTLSLVYSFFMCDL